MTRVMKACMAACLLSAAFGCDPIEPEPEREDPGPGPTPTAWDAGSNQDAGPAPTALLRVVHASPDAPAVDLYLQGSSSPVVANLSYTETSAFVSVLSGTFGLDVRPAGSDPLSPALYSTGPVTLAEGTETTAIAAGLLSSPNGDGFRVIPLTHGFGEAVAGTARARVVHAVSDAPAVDLDVGDDGTPELPNVEPFSESGAEGFTLPAGTALQVGVGAQGARFTALTTPALPDGAEVFFIATGLLQEKPYAERGFGVLAVGPDGTLGLVRQNPIVYLLHASPDAPPVDLFVGNAELSDELAFGELSAPVQVAPGTYVIDFFAHELGAVRPVGTPATTEVLPALEAGERYVVIATGFLTPETGERDFQLLAAPERFADAGGEARVRVIQASPDAPPVDVGALSGDTFTPLTGLTNLDFGSKSAPEGMETVAGDLVISVAETGSTTPEATFDVSFGAGQEAFVIAAGAFTPVKKPGIEEDFRLISVDTTQWPWSAVSVAPR